MAWIFHKTSHKKAFDQKEKHSVVTETYRATKSKDTGFPDFPSGINTTSAFDRSLSKSQGSADYTESYYTDFPTSGSLSIRASLTEEPLETHPKWGKKGTSKIEDKEWSKYRKWKNGEIDWSPSKDGTANFQIFWGLKDKGIESYLSCNIEAQLTIFQNTAADSTDVGKTVTNSLLPTLSDQKTWILFSLNGQKEGATGKWKNTYVFKASGFGGWDDDLYKSGTLNLQSPQGPTSPSAAQADWKCVRVDKRYDDRQGQDLVTEYHEGICSDIPSHPSNVTGGFDRVLEYSEGLAKYQVSYYTGNTDAQDGFIYNTTLSQEPLETHPRYRTGGDKVIQESEWIKYRKWKDDPSSTDWTPDSASSEFFDFWTKKNAGVDNWLNYNIEAQATEILTSQPSYNECGKVVSLPAPRAITLKSGRTWLLVSIESEQLSTSVWRVSKTYRSSSDGGWETLLYT